MKRTFTCVRKTLLALSITTISLIFATSCFMGGSSDGSSDIPVDYSGYIQDFYIDSLSTGNKGNVLYDIDFESGVKPYGCYGNGKYSQDDIYAKWSENNSRAPNVLKDNHGKVYCLNQISQISSSSYFEMYVNLPEDAVLTFQFRSDLANVQNGDNLLRLKIDDNTWKIGHNPNGDGWRKVSVEIKQGKHKIKWFIPQYTGFSGNVPNILHVLYLDNITIAPKAIEFIELYPKGEQETYKNGTPIRFKALALRSDRTVDDKAKITYSVSGCGEIDRNGVFYPKGKGKARITAQVANGPSVSQYVYVHGDDYLSDVVTIGDYSFSGVISRYSKNNVEIESLDTLNTTFSYPSPKTNVFAADGFFVIKGNTKVPLLIEVAKNGSKYKTNYLIRNKGDFYKRLWLRFGSGEYIIKIAEAPNMSFFNTLDSKYEGDFKGVSRAPVVKTLYVNNTSNIKEEESLWLLPSEVVQSDSLIISNAVKSIKATLKPGYSNGDLLRAIHDWEIHNLHYDNVSVNHTERRKRQDSEHVIKYGMGVCEGYSNLYAALVRKVGFKAKVIGEATMSHAWNQIYYGSNWYLVDTTFDDPISSKSDNYIDKAEGSENYTFFMTALTDETHRLEGVPTVDNRSIGDIEVIPTVKGMPDGWY